MHCKLKASIFTDLVVTADFRFHFKTLEDLDVSIGTAKESDILEIYNKKLGKTYFGLRGFMRIGAGARDEKKS